MTRHIAPFSFLLTIITVLSLACGGSADTAATPQRGVQFPVSIRQSDGQTLTVSQSPQRIVSLSAHATEIFCAIGAGSQLVAVDRFANCPAGSSSKPEVDSFRPNLEAIAGYRPDLVYVASNLGEVVQGLRRLGIAVLFVEVPTDLPGVFDHIRTLGSAVGRSAEAKSLTDSMAARLQAVRDKVSSVGSGPRVFHELDADYYTVAPTSFVGAFYTTLKAQNIAAGAATDYPQLSAEVIVQRNPEVIVLADEASGVTPAQVRARPGWSAVEAVKAGRICVVDADVVSRPGPRVVEALEVLGKCLYPDRFK